MQGEFWPSTGPTSDDMTTCEHSLSETRASGELTSSQEASLASQSVWREKWNSNATLDGCGQNSAESFAFFDPNTSSWKTYQGCLYEDYTTYSVIFPRAGTMRNGMLFRLVPLVRTSLAKEFLSSPKVPRPLACDGKGAGRSQRKLNARGGEKNLRDYFLRLHNWLYPPVAAVEYLMGFPIGWTDLEGSETRLSRK